MLEPWAEERSLTLQHSEAGTLLGENLGCCALLPVLLHFCSKNSLDKLAFSAYDEAVICGDSQVLFLSSLFPVQNLPTFRYSPQALLPHMSICIQYVALRLRW